MIKRDLMKKRLIRNGMAEDYADRLLAELSEHNEDIVHEKIECGYSREEAEKEASEIIGSCDILVDSACMKMRQDSFMARNTFFTFAVLPIFVLFAVFLTVIEIASACAGILDIESHAFKVLCSSGLFILRYGITVGIAILFCLLPKRLFLPITWSLIPCFIMALAGIFFINIQPPIAGPGTGLLYIGLSFSGGSGVLSYLAVFNSIRFYLPLLVFATFVVSSKRIISYAE